MDHQPLSRSVSRPQMLAERAFLTFERFIRIEAASVVVLLIAVALALIWANSPIADSYHAFWHLLLSVGLGEFVFSRSLHFWINAALMTIFFLVVGMEIRREIHEGALSRFDQALLPVVAAAGGVLVPSVTWNGVWLVGFLAGIGFTMSIFIAMLAFENESHLGAAKLGVLIGSLIAAVIGLVWGAAYIRRMRRVEALDTVMAH